MARFPRLQRPVQSALLASAAVLLGAGTPTLLAQKAAETGTQAGLGTWSDTIWQAAIDGDQERIEAMLSEIPEGSVGERVAELRRQVEGYRQHVSDAESLSLIHI